MTDEIYKCSSVLFAVYKPAGTSKSNKINLTVRYKSKNVIASPYFHVKYFFIKPTIQDAFSTAATVIK